MGTVAGRASATRTEDDLVYRKVLWRLIPLLFLCCIAACRDRVNVGFAKLQMLKDLSFSEAIYGTGAGIFFIGCFLFEVPSNLILHRVGARRWIARIMITGGLISGATLFVNLVGAASAPGIAIINSIGNPAGFVSPSIVGWIRDTTGTADDGPYVISACLAAAALALAALRTMLAARATR